MYYDLWRPVRRVRLLMCSTMTFIRKTLLRQFVALVGLAGLILLTSGLARSWHIASHHSHAPAERVAAACGHSGCAAEQSAETPDSDPEPHGPHHDPHCPTCEWIAGAGKSAALPDLLALIEPPAPASREMARPEPFALPRVGLHTVSPRGPPA